MADGMKVGSDDMSVTGMLRLARNNAVATRRKYAALSEALVDGGTADIVLTDQQRSILSQLLRQVIGDIYASLHWLVLAGIEDGGDPAHNGWSDLAPDGAARVFSFLSKRGLLKDTALMEAVAHRLYQHELEQATRPPDRNRWTNAPSLENPHDFFDQPIPEFSPVNRRIAAYVVDRSRRTDHYGNPVLLPNEMETELYTRLHWRVAAAVRYMLVDRFGEDLELLDSRIEAASVETIRHSLAIAATPTSTAEVVRALESAGLLSVETVHRLIKAGEIALFEETFAKLAGIRPVLLRRLIYEAGGECFAVLVRALDVEFDQAKSIFTMIRSGSTQYFRERNGADDPLTAIYGAVSFADANVVRAHWMRQPDFAAALREADPTMPDGTAMTLH